MKIAPRWCRRIEIALWIMGVSLLAGALGATMQRDHYQAEQEQALFQALASAPQGVEASGPACSVTITVTASRILPMEEGLSPRPEPGEVFGPPPPEAVGQPKTAEQPDVPAERRASRERNAALAVDAFGMIEIPRIGVKAIVREGADEKTLARAVGLIPGTARPGEGGNVVLAGHRDSFFRPLRKIRVNDRIRLVVPGETYEYRVEATRIVEPHETRVMDSRGVDELTLVTCYPFRFVGPAPERFIVTARRVDGAIDD